VVAFVQTKLVEEPWRRGVPKYLVVIVSRDRCYDHNFLQFSAEKMAFFRRLVLKNEMKRSSKFELSWVVQLLKHAYYRSGTSVGKDVVEFSSLKKF
jgi:hypothetical protein